MTATEVLGIWSRWCAARAFDYWCRIWHLYPQPMITICGADTDDAGMLLLCHELADHQPPHRDRAYGKTWAA